MDYLILSLALAAILVIAWAVSPKCPYCGSHRSVEVRTHGTANHYTQTRKCLDCHKTYEIGK